MESNILVTQPYKLRRLSGGPSTAHINLKHQFSMCLWIFRSQRKSILRIGPSSDLISSNIPRIGTAEVAGLF